SILGNLLFVTGACMLAGGWRRSTQKFNALAAESQAGQLILALSAVLVPALFFRSAIRANQPGLIHPVSIGTAIILLVSYVLGLFFAFKTHREHLSAVTPPPEAPGEVWGVKRAIALLFAASVLMGVVAEGLVHAVGAAGKAWGMNEVFLGFVILAIVGNAA